MSAGTDRNDDVDIALAGEYVLRVLSPDDQAAFEARLAVEPTLRRMVADWEADLAILAEDAPPMAPSPQVFAKIDAALFPAPARRRTPWGLWGGALAGLAMLGAVAFVALDRSAPQGPSYQAQIAADDASLVVEAAFADGLLRVARLEGAPRAGRTLELWLIAEGASAPVSLGLIEAAVVQIALDETLQAALAGGTLAISDEPPGGSPTGAPTGDVLALGAVSTL